MYLVLSAFASIPVSLLVTAKASAFSLIVCTFPERKLEADVCHVISSHPSLPEPPNGML